MVVGEGASETTITVPSGRTKADLPDTRLAWADFTSIMRGAENPSGGAIFVSGSYSGQQCDSAPIARLMPGRLLGCGEGPSVEITGSEFTDNGTGSAIDGANVRWRVVREVRYPAWWYWRCCRRPAPRRRPRTQRRWRSAAFVGCQACCAAY